MQQGYDALAEADVPVIMVHDDMVWTSGAIFRPAWYRRHVFPNYRRLFAPLLDSGKKIIFTSDGNYSEFIDDLAGAGVHGSVLVVSHRGLDELAHAPAGALASVETPVGAH